MLFPAAIAFELPAPHSAIASAASGEVASADSLKLLFGDLVGNTELSNFPCSFITGARPKTSQCDLCLGKHGISRFPRKIFPLRLDLKTLFRYSGRQVAGLLALANCYRNRYNLHNFNTATDRWNAVQFKPFYPSSLKLLRHRCSSLMLQHFCELFPRDDG
jgi:hypothetical protein